MYSDCAQMQLDKGACLKEIEGAIINALRSYKVSEIVYHIQVLEPQRSSPGGLQRTHLALKAFFELLNNFCLTYLMHSQ